MYLYVWGARVCISLKRGETALLSRCGLRKAEKVWKYGIMRESNTCQDEDLIVCCTFDREERYHRQFGSSAALSILARIRHPCGAVFRLYSQSPHHLS